VDRDRKQLANAALRNVLFTSRAHENWHCRNGCASAAAAINRVTAHARSWLLNRTRNTAESLGENKPHVIRQADRRQSCGARIVVTSMISTRAENVDQTALTATEKIEFFGFVLPKPSS